MDEAALQPRAQVAAFGLDLQPLEVAAAIHPLDPLDLAPCDAQCAECLAAHHDRAVEHLALDPGHAQPLHRQRLPPIEHPHHDLGPGERLDDRRQPLGAEVGVVDAEEDPFRVFRPGGPQQVDAGAVAIIDLGVEPGGALDLLGLAVDQRDGHALGHEHLRDGLAEAPIADHDGVGLGAELGPVEIDASLGHPHLQPADRPHQERRRDHRGGDDRAQQACLAGADDPARRACGEQDEAELAGLAEQQRKARGAPFAHPERARDRVKQGRLHRDHRRRQPDHRQRLRGHHPQVEQHSDRHEEQAEQDRAERLDIAFQFVAIGALGQHHARDEGSERHRQVQRMHHRRRAEHGEQPGDHE